MEIRYDKLFVQLKQRNLLLKRLKEDVKFSNSTVNRLRHNEPVTTETIGKLCAYLKCTPNDVMEIIYDNSMTYEEIAKKRQLAELENQLAELKAQLEKGGSKNSDHI